MRAYTTRDFFIEDFKNLLNIMFAYERHIILSNMIPNDPNVRCILEHIAAVVTKGAMDTIILFPDFLKLRMVNVYFLED